MIGNQISKLSLEANKSKGHPWHSQNKNKTLILKRQYLFETVK